MRIAFETISVKTKEEMQLLDITQMVRDFLDKYPIRDGVLLLNTLHTTAVLFINEFQAALIEDMKTILTSLVQEKEYYRHNDPEYSDCTRSNAGSHLRAMLLARTLALPVRAGEVVLGRWQSIIFAELDGPQERSIQFQVLGE
ncbi:MAG: secondary thiamine-phosphate synthase enzyme YjbQ [Candidatus Methylomirabilales bacterium]